MKTTFNKLMNDRSTKGEFIRRYLSSVCAGLTVKILAALAAGLLTLILHLTR